MWNHKFFLFLHICCWTCISNYCSALYIFARRTSNFYFPSNPCFDKRCQILSRRLKTDLHDEEETSLLPSDLSSCSRRLFTSTLAISLVSVAATKPACASELGAMITKAVTTSDLGISVRKSVVKGAQMMDRIDGQWEKFSDDYGLGAARLSQGGRPQPRNIPPLKPLNVEMAKTLLDLSDESFMEQSGISPNLLSLQINKVDNAVRKSFERSGIDFSDEMTGSIFNYYCYIHFKAYCDIIVSMKIGWNKKAFENILGDKLLPVLAPSYDSVKRDIATSGGINSKFQQRTNLLRGFEAGLKLTDEILTNLVSNGFVALAERNQIDNEKLADWSDDLADIQLSIPLDGDITLNSQVLLQEQGFRVYPDFARFAIASAFQQALTNTNQNVSSDEYYMDTDYSSDPDQFEVKQVLLNVVIDSN